MVYLVFCFRFGFCVNTWLYLWGWFFQVYLWLDKYIVEGCMYLWLDKYMYLRVACTCELSIGTHEACYLHLCVHKYFWQECVYTCVRLLHVLVIWQNKTDQVWFLLVCILVVIPLHVETYMYIYTFVKGSGFKPQCVASRLLSLCASTWQHWMLWCKKGWGKTKMIGVPSRQTESASLLTPTWVSKDFKFVWKTFWATSKPRIFGFAFLHHQEPLAPMGGIHLHMVNG